MKIIDVASVRQVLNILVGKIFENLFVCIQCVKKLVRKLIPYLLTFDFFNSQDFDAETIFKTLV